jgi:dolichol-phosphate mannosyltransferase
MTDELAAAALPVGQRVRAGMRKPASWAQLVRFGLVGASGYVVNLAVYTAALQLAGFDFRVASATAFLVAVLNNFFWNRRWTFRARDGHAGFQAARFFVVSICAWAVSLGILQLLVVEAGVEKVAAQAIAIVLATPFNFLGNKLWSFAA